MHLNLSADVPIWLNINGPAAEIDAELSRQLATAAANYAYVAPVDSPSDLRSRVYSACVSQVCNISATLVIKSPNGRSSGSS